jgi:ATP-binding cassette subfamily B (MDR/TAP) protein 1
MRQRYDELLEEPLKIASRKGNIAGLLYGLSQMILSCILALIFFVGSIFIRDLNMDVLKVFTAIYAIMFAAIQAGGNLQFVPNIVQLKVAAVNIFKVLDQ